MKEETKLKIGKSKENCSDERAIEIYNKLIDLKLNHNISYVTSLKNGNYEIKDWTRLKKRVMKIIWTRGEDEKKG
jgi:hypothetical protein